MTAVSEKTTARHTVCMLIPTQNSEQAKTFPFPKATLP